MSEYTGHGIGSEMHQPPDVPNLGRPGRGELLVKGMCLAIEPMITAGSAVTATLDDEWTVVTRDGSPAAHWEHTVALTRRGRLGADGRGRRGGGTRRPRGEVRTAGGLKLLRRSAIEGLQFVE